MRVLKKYSKAFIVKDPKTYMNAEEAWYQFQAKKKECILFIIYPRTNPLQTFERLNEVIDKKKWNEIIWIKTASNTYEEGFKKILQKKRWLKKIMSYRELLFNYIDRVRIDSIAKNYQSVEVVFSGYKNTQEHLTANLKPEKLYLLETGRRTLERLKKSDYIDHRKHANKKRLLRIVHKYFIRFQVFDRKKTAVFTSYKDKIETKHALVHNDQSYKKERIKQKAVGDYILWISSDLVLKIDTTDIRVYTEYIKASMRHLKCDYSKIRYIPHPLKETDSDIEYVRDSLNCEIDDRMIPVEMKLINYPSLPYACVSPLSSALVNISFLAEKKFKIYSAWHYEFNHFQDLTEWRKNIEHNKNLDINFIEVQDCISLFQIKYGETDDFPIYRNFRDYSGKKTAEL